MPLPDIAMSPPSRALSSRSLAAGSPLRTSVFFHSAACSVLETTYFWMSLITSPNGWSAFWGQYAAHSS